MNVRRAVPILIGIEIVLTLETRSIVQYGGGLMTEDMPEHETPNQPESAQEINKPNVSVLRKRAARIAAVQCMYAKMMEQSNTTETLIEWQLQLMEEATQEDGKPRKLNQNLLRSIFVGTMDMFGALNERASEILAERWSGGRMPKVMRCILLCALYELVYTPSLRSDVVLNQYGDIAAMFMDENDVDFVHSALHQCIDAVRGNKAEA